MKRIHIPLTILLVTIWIFARGTAHGQGLYLGLEIGRNSHSGMNITGSSNDRASVCDEYINPMYATVTQTAGYENYNCTGSNRGAGDNWSNSFDGARGILSGFVLGYRAWENDLAGMRVRLRPEFEYSYQVSQYNQTSEIPFAEGASGDKLRQEIWVANDRIGTLTGHNLFGNLYLDFINSTRITPYTGFGMGVGLAQMGYSGVWARNADPTAISTGEGLPNVEEIRRNLAGTTSVAQEVLSDTLFGYQVLFGVDYEMTESVSLGVKGRWVNFSSFRDDGIEWIPLRSHVPNVRRDGSEPVSGTITTDDMTLLGFSLSLTYHF